MIAALAIPGVVTGITAYLFMIEAPPLYRAAGFGASVSACLSTITLLIDYMRLRR
jgi:hypothetical protein